MHELNTYLLYLGIINTDADYKVLYIDVLPNGGLSFNRTIDTAALFPQYGGAKPHSVYVVLSSPGRN